MSGPRHKEQTPKQLEAVQRLMARCVMRPLTSSYRIQSRWEDGRSAASIAESFVKPNDRLTSLERLQIYNRQYWFRILDAFEEDFPGLLAILGRSRFEKLKKAYLTRYPSNYFSLRNLGSRLEKFIRENPKWTGSHQALCQDMARFEWAQVEVFDREERPVFDPKDLQGKSPGQIHLPLQPYLRLLELEYPLDDYLVAVKRRDAFRQEASNTVDHLHPRRIQKIIRRPRPRKTYLMVHRLNFRIYYKKLDPVAFQILEYLAEGDNLQRACSRALRRTRTLQQDWSRRIHEWFQHWMSLGWFCKESHKKP